MLFLVRTLIAMKAVKAFGFVFFQAVFLVQGAEWVCSEFMSTMLFWFVVALRLGSVLAVKIFGLVFGHDDSQIGPCYRTNNVDIYLLFALIYPKCLMPFIVFLNLVPL
jgi:hypothetical protein